MLHRNIILKRNPFFALDSLLENFDWMRSDIGETETAFQISVELPGIKKDQVEVSLEAGGNLVIEVKQEEGNEKSLHTERRQQRFGRRVFQVGSVSMRKIFRPDWKMVCCASNCPRRSSTSA